MDEIPEMTITTPTETIEVPAPKKTRKKPVTKTKARDLADLDKIDPKKMSPAEAILYINACREVLSIQNKKIDELDINCKQAYEQSRTISESYRKLKDEADSKLGFAQRAIQTCYESIKIQGGTRA